MTKSSDIQGFDKWQAVYDVLCKFGGSLLYNDSKDTWKWTLTTGEPESWPRYSETEIRCAIIKAFDVVKYRQSKDGSASSISCMKQSLTKADVDDIIENLRSAAWFDNGATASNMSRFILETE